MTDNIRKQVFSTADAAVNGSRELNYGKPESNFQHIASFWNIYLIRKGLSINLQPVDVVTMLILLKMSRLINTPSHFDSWADIAGYAACGAEVANAIPKEDK